MTRRMRRVNIALAIACVVTAVVNVADGNLPAASLAAVLTVWILLANSLGRRLNDANAYVESVIDAWREDVTRRSNARDRAQRIRDYHRASLQVHAIGHPCGGEGPTLSLIHI